MSKPTPKQMAETIRKGDPLGKDFLQKVSDTLTEIDGVGYQQFLRLRDENERLRVVLQKIYKVDQHPNFRDAETPIIGTCGKIAWNALKKENKG